MKKRLLTILAAVALVCSLSSNAFALRITDENVMGTVWDAMPFGDDKLTEYVNILLNVPINSANVSIGTEFYTRTAVVGGSSSVSLADSFKPSSGSLIGAGWEYAIAKYNGPNGGAVLFYLGGAAFQLPTTSQGLWENNQGNGYSLSGFRAYNSVPDGGSAAAMLGAALMGIGLLRRRFGRS